MKTKVIMEGNGKKGGCGMTKESCYKTSWIGIMSSICKVMVEYVRERSLKWQSAWIARRRRIRQQCQSPFKFISVLNSL